MKRKINIQFIIVAFLAIAMTLIFATAAFYRLFKDEVLESLNSYAHMLAESIDVEMVEQYDTRIDGIRISIIDKEGNVCYDSAAAVDDMENHSDRPEIREAFLQGEGTAVRKSYTMEKNAFYYAVQIDDNYVVRVSKEANSIWSIFENVIPIVVGMTLILAFICVLLAHFLTKSLVEPIEQMANNLDNLGEISTYKELTPFISLIQKQHEDIVRNANMRQEFTANVSHELKTPLTSISGYSELIENGMAQDKDIPRFAGEIHRNAKRLLTLINDIINLAQLDSKELTVEFSEVDLYSIAENCVNMLSLNAENHGIQFHLSGGHEWITANKEMIEEVVYNLCDNAIRYNNPGGSVYVNVQEADRKVVLTIRDTGIGISKEHQERIFERFYRVDKSRSKSTGGTGLGLAIVKHIVAKHNAVLELESDVGKGTTIKILFDKK